MSIVVLPVVESSSTSAPFSDSLGQSGVSAASGGVSSQQGGLARTGFGAVSVAVGGALVLGAGTVMVLRSRRRAS